MTNNDIKELTDFLDTYGVKYKVVGDRVVSEEVELANRSISKLPEGIGNLKCRYLWLDNNQLTSLPDSIGDLKCRYLWLDNNKLTSLPDSIGNLKCEYLRLNNNQLTSLPDSIGNLKCDVLWLDNNQLTSKSIELLEKLKSNGVNVIYRHTNNGCKIMTNNDIKELTEFPDTCDVDYKIVENRVVEAYAMKKQTKQEILMECIKTEVKHSLSKTAWNVVGTQFGRKYKIARVPYLVIEGNEILATRNKHEALEHALFISRCFNEKHGV